MSLIIKIDCVIVTNLNHTVRHICHVAEVCSKMLKDFHDYCLFNLSGIVFSCFWLKNYKNIVWRYSMTNKQYFCIEEFLKLQKIVWMLSYRVCMTVRYHKQLVKFERQTVYSGFFLQLFTQIIEFEGKHANKRFETEVLVWKPKNKKSNQPIFYTLEALCLKVNDKLMCLKASVTLNTK